MLGGLGFQLLRACDIGDKGNVYVAYVLASLLGAYLTYSLKEGVDSISPTVPPISVMTTSAFASLAAL